MRFLLRVSLGITTVLTMTFLGLEARTDLPKVSYPTALDFFVFLSFAFIFATILQFAVVHYFTKYGSGEFYFNFHEESSSDDEDAFIHSSHVSSLTHIETVDIIPLSSFELSDDERKSSSKASKSFRQFMAKYFLCLTSSERREMESEASPMSRNTPPCKNIQKMRQGRGNSRGQGRSRNYNSVSKIDKCSRIAFPLLFFAINLLYWVFYLTRSQRK